MLTAKLAAELCDVAITVVAISPGWVRTDMGAPQAPLSAQESVASLLGVIKQLDLSRSGQSWATTVPICSPQAAVRDTAEPSTINRAGVNLRVERGASSFDRCGPQAGAAQPAVPHRRSIPTSSPRCLDPSSASTSRRSRTPTCSPCACLGGLPWSRLTKRLTRASSVSCPC